MSTVYAVYVNTDLTEGRGPMRLLALFASEDDAQLAREGWGIMGRSFEPGQDTELREVEVFESFDAYVASLRPGSQEERAVRDYKAANDAEYREFLRLHEKFLGGRP